jgi:creatinine amidohydrolase
MPPRPRSFAELTMPEIVDAVERGAGVILPVGSTEQHGPHLPLSTDAIIPTAMALAMAEALDMLVAPAITYGYRSRPLSGGGQGWIGTTSVSGRTLMSVVEDVLTELIRHGFRRLVILNWHYENTNFLYEAAWLARERAATTGNAPEARIMVIEAAFAELSPTTMDALFEDEFPGWDVEHAAVLETSLLLHLRPDLVLMDRAVDDAAPRHPFYDVVPIPDDFVSATGVLYKATRATAAKGAIAWPELVGNVRQAIEDELGGAALRPVLAAV